jgi:hypothetical protein
VQHKQAALLPRQMLLAQLVVSSVLALVLVPPLA